MELDGRDDFHTVDLFKYDGASLGFNVIGGSDHPHIPGDCGIFVSKVKPDGIAALDGRLTEGDRILTINGSSLLNLSHDDAVGIFRSANGNVILEIEKNAQKRVINSPPSSSRSNSNNYLKDIATDGTTNDDHLDKPVVSTVEGEMTETKHDGIGDLMQADVTDNGGVVDDVPKTPKRSHSAEPLSSVLPPYFYESLITVIGIATLSAFAYFAYRRLSR